MEEDLEVLSSQPPTEQDLVDFESLSTDSGFDWDIQARTSLPLIPLATSTDTPQERRRISLGGEENPPQSDSHVLVKYRATKPSPTWHVRL